MAIVILFIAFKHWAIIFNLSIKADDLELVLNAKETLFDYGIYSLLTTIFCIVILALMHRPSNIGYDTLLKKEIWGVWYQENNSTEYFEKREQKFQKELKDE